MKRQNKVMATSGVGGSHKNMSFHLSMRNILLTVQVFGFMPVIGIWQPQISRVKFSRISWRMLYCLLTLFGAVFLSGLQLKKIFSVAIKMRDIHRFCLYVMEVCSCLLFIMVAKKWAQFTKIWNKVDQAMSRYGWPTELNRKINCITIVFVVLVCSK